MALIGAILPAILAGAIKAAVTGAIQNVPVASGSAGAIATEVVKRLAANPVVVNEVNAEKPVQSRVVVGSTAAVAGALGIVLTEISSNRFPNYNYAILMPALGILWGAGYALYGRLASGLKPLFSRS